MKTLTMLTVLFATGFAATALRTGQSPGQAEANFWTGVQETQKSHWHLWEHKFPKNISMRR